MILRFIYNVNLNTFISDLRKKRKKHIGTCPPKGVNFDSFCPPVRDWGTLELRIFGSPPHDYSKT